MEVHSLVPRPGKSLGTRLGSARNEDIWLLFMIGPAHFQYSFYMCNIEKLGMNE